MQHEWQKDWSAHDTTLDPYALGANRTSSDVVKGTNSDIADYCEQRFIATKKYVEGHKGPMIMQRMKLSEGKCVQDEYSDLCVYNKDTALKPAGITKAGIIADETKAGIIADETKAGIIADETKAGEKIVKTKGIRKSRIRGPRSLRKSPRSLRKSPRSLRKSPRSLRKKWQTKGMRKGRIQGP
jgi:hypothetical protein